MEAGGVAAMEVVARDLKALGLYQARALAYHGVEVDILVHQLSEEQRRIYDSYAGAFKVIHANIEAALEATGIMQEGSTLNKNAKSAALSAFESTKQRFFGHLLTAMKCPSLIRAIQSDLDSGRSAVIQLVSTGEALMERRIAEIPASEWDDLGIDLTPREHVLDFLAHAFPVQLQEPFTDSDGNLMSRPAVDADGHPILCQEALAQRDALLEQLASLPPVPSALDQVVQHFGHETVAEVTGRSRRVLRISDGGGERLALRSRPASANLAETAAFMERSKRIPRVLHGRGHRAELPLGPLVRQHRAPGPLPAGAGLARRPGHPGAGPHPPHTPGLSAALPAGHHRREGRAAVHRHHRAQARQPRSHHARATRLPDRHGRQRRHVVPRKRQPGEPLRQGGPEAVLPGALARGTSPAGPCNASRRPPA